MTAAPLHPRDERGFAIVIALMAVLLLSALGAGLVLTTTSETLIAGNYRDGAEALYAADAGLERALPDLLNADDWAPVLAGGRQSTFVDGAPGGDRAASFGVIDLTGVTNVLNCGKPSACSDAEMDAATAERPWGANNPRWQPYAYGPLSNLLADGSVVSPMYVVVWAADDSGETDGDPLVDANGRVVLRAEAFGPGGVHKAIETTVTRAEMPGNARSAGYRAQRGQNEQNLRVRDDAGVNAPARSSMGLAAGGLAPQ